jgi:LacI family transcriptional regulator
MIATMKDVAATAGVSVATVSRVLSGETRVAETKRVAVMAACRKLGYRPDPVAAALRSGSSGSVGMVVPDISNPFFPSVIQRVEHELSIEGINLVFCDAADDVGAEAERVQALLRRRVDGLLICPVDGSLSAPTLLAAARHTQVLQFERFAIETTDYVGVDQDVGMSAVVEHLRGLGVGEAIFVGGASGISSLAERATAFERACGRYGLAMRPPATLPRHNIEAGRHWAVRLLRGGDVPPAIVCVNDQVAFGVLTELRLAGLRCPGEVMLVGYDDVPAADLLGLTTVRQPLSELGREAVRMLRERSEVPRRVRLVPTLVVRDSTAGQAGDETDAVPSNGPALQSRRLP